MAEYRREYDDEPKATEPSIRDRLNRLQERAAEMEAAVEKFGTVLETVCREIGLDVRAFRD